MIEEVIITFGMLWKFKHIPTLTTRCHNWFHGYRTGQYKRCKNSGKIRAQTGYILKSQCRLHNHQATIDTKPTIISDYFCNQTKLFTLRAIFCYIMSILPNFVHHTFSNTDLYNIYQGRQKSSLQLQTVCLSVNFSDKYISFHRNLETIK